MTRIIELGNRGRIVVYTEGQEIKVSNESSGTLVLDNELLHPGETR